MDRYFFTIDRAVKAGCRRASRRALAVLAVAVAVFALAGDGGVRSATSTGADPLELLKLQAKANAFIILDTSGSMGETQGSVNSNRPASDDYTLGKLSVAKSVLTNIITTNQASVAFSFGTYTQGTTTLSNSTTRFLYATTATDSPGMVTSQIIANSGGSSGTMPVGRTTGASDTFVESGDTRYLLHADRFVNGVTYRVYGNTVGTRHAGDVCSATAGTATGLPTVTLIKLNNTSGTGTNCTTPTTLSTATFTFVGAEAQQWSLADSDASCGGYQQRVALAPCSQTEQLTANGISDFLRPALRMSSDYKTIQGYAENGSGSITGTGQPTVNGLRAAGYTPLANTLLDFKTIWDNLWTNTIASQTTKQSSFAIILTDGDDTCATKTGGGGSATDNNALRAAYDAQVLYAAHNDGVNAATRFRTFVVFLGTSTSRANWIAWGGTGMTHTATGSGTATMWNAAPTAAQRTACTTCVDAFTATNTDDLTAALQAAINLGQTGNFADRAVIASVFELTATPLDPTTWIHTSVPELFQSTWVVPGFQGHLTAFANVTPASTTSCPPTLPNCQWDAGPELLTRVTITPSGGLAGVTFAQLHGGANDGNVGGSSAMIKRRIYTTSGNGTNASYTASNVVNQSSLGSMRVALWPPAAGVDPASGTGTFDVQLFSGIATDATNLGTLFGACKGTPLPAACSGGTQQAQAQKEAREMVLAYMAGAQVLLTSGAPTRDLSGNVLYGPRSWILADSTGAAPAVAIPPPSTLSATLHTPEWGLFLNAHASGNVVPAGLSLWAQTVMTVVYLPANDMLHALRAGPCPGGGCSGDTGGEELWGFVPYDQLGKLTTRLLTPNQSATDYSQHIYMMAAPVRLAHVFVPGTWSMGGNSGTGVWRTVLLAGRGPGGKYLTALDVTGPGPTTTASLSTTAPIVMWNRTYPGMGETWSVPAVGPVNPTANGGVEFVAYVGSGYSDVVGESTTFYALNVINGDVLAQYDVGLGGGAYNAIVASPSLFQPNLLSPTGSTILGPTDPATFVYFPDVQGRIFRFDTAQPSTAPVLVKNYTGAQPFGVATTLLSFAEAGNSQAKPHVYAAAGADSRVTADHAFKMVGLKDDNTPATELFALDFASGFRGTVQPVGVYDDSVPIGALALFVGTKYTPATTQCVSSFDSVLFIVEAATGLAGYNLPDNGGRSIGIPDQKVTDLGMAGGRARVAGGLHPDTPIPPPTESGTRSSDVTVSVGPPSGFAPKDGTTSFKLGSNLNVACR